MPEEQKRKIGDANFGKKRSPEICEKLSEQRKGRKRAPNTPEHTEKIRQAHLGKKKRPRTEEEKAQYTERLKARWANMSEVERAIQVEKARAGRIKWLESKKKGG
jgi:hypothetical protein